jgi:hypothetical protein
VADVAVVVWRDDPGRPRCSPKTSNARVALVDDFGSADPEYAACISGWTGYALADMFSRLGEIGSPKTVLVPPVATGVGSVAPEAFYLSSRSKDN